jgi:hypothetical protein
MNFCEFCIVGAGPAGYGALKRLLNDGKTNVMLFEAKSEPLYSLTSMHAIPLKNDIFPQGITSSAFRSYLLSDSKAINHIKLDSRLLGIDLHARTCIINHDGKENKVIHFQHLLLATGAMQAITPEMLLPGFRGAGIFTVYQVLEMLTHFNFIPGRHLGILGESEYSLELAMLARKKGIEPYFFSNSGIEESIPYREIVRAVGDEHMCALEYITPSGSLETFSLDSLAIDGHWSMEHKMRELIGIEWDIDAWHAKTGENQSVPGHPEISVIGDAYEPRFDFLEQYANGYNVAGRLA